MNEPASRHQPPTPWREQGTVITAISLGGGLGACARYGAGRLWPTPEGAFPWTTLTVNAGGCALMGVLMVLVSDVWAAHQLLRPFLGTGVLGGFTTFSLYTHDLQDLVEAGRARAALGYLTLTVAAALAAVWLASTATRAAATRRRRWRR